MGQHFRDRVDPRRLDELWERAGFKNPRQLALAVGVSADQPARWREGKTAPAGPTLARLCDVLKTTPDYLFGRAVPTEDDRRAALLAQLRDVLGRAEADAVEMMLRLTPHHRAILAGRIVGWVEGLEQYERLHPDAPQTPFERDLELIQAGAIEPPATEPAGGEDVESAPRSEEPAPALRAIALAARR